MKEILFSLFKDARKSGAEIGRETGHSRQMVKKTIDKLEDENVIWGYCPVVDARKMGMCGFLIFLKFHIRSTSKDVVKGVISEAKKDVNHPDKDIIFIDSGYVHGCIDLYIKILGKDLISVKKFVNILKMGYPDVIDSVEIVQEIVPIRICGIVNPNLIADVNNIIK